MKAGIVIPARDGSIRLPRKHLEDLGGKPMLQRLLDRIGGEVPIVIATTPSSTGILGAWPAWSDSSIPDDDVTLRVARCALEHHLDPVIVVNGDSPWMDRDFLQDALETFLRDDVDLLWNESPGGV